MGDYECKFKIGEIIRYCSDDSVLGTERKILKQETRNHQIWGFCPHYKIRFFNYDKTEFEDDWAPAWIIDEKYQEMIK